MVTTSSDIVFRALGDPTRRAILDHLRGGARPVNDIARRFEMSRPAVSKHLRVLREARLVIDHKEGRQRICVLDPIPLRQVDGWISEFRDAWRDRLGALKAHVEASAQTTAPAASRTRRR